MPSWAHTAEIEISWNKAAEVGSSVHFYHDLLAVMFYFTTSVIVKWVLSFKCPWSEGNNASLLQLTYMWHCHGCDWQDWAVKTGLGFVDTTPEEGSHRPVLPGGCVHVYVHMMSMSLCLLGKLSSWGSGKQQQPRIGVLVGLSHNMLTRVTDVLERDPSSFPRPQASTGLPLTVQKRIVVTGWG